MLKILIIIFFQQAAIEYDQKNLEFAKEALTDLPPRSEEELDPVTLHNHALMFMDDEPGEGFEKLQFLVQQVRKNCVKFLIIFYSPCSHHFHQKHLQIYYCCIASMNILI